LPELLWRPAASPSHRDQPSPNPCKTGDHSAPRRCRPLQKTLGDVNTSVSRPWAAGRHTPTGRACADELRGNSPNCRDSGWCCSAAGGAGARLAHAYAPALAWRLASRHQGRGADRRCRLASRKFFGEGRASRLRCRRIDSGRRHRSRPSVGTCQPRPEGRSLRTARPTVVAEIIYFRPIPISLWRRPVSSLPHTMRRRHAGFQAGGGVPFRRSPWRKPDTSSYQPLEQEELR